MATVPNYSCDSAFVQVWPVGPPLFESPHSIDTSGASVVFVTALEEYLAAVKDYTEAAKEYAELAWQDGKAYGTVAQSAGTSPADLPSRSERRDNAARMVNAIELLCNACHRYNEAFARAAPATASGHAILKPVARRGISLQTKDGGYYVDENCERVEPPRLFSPKPEAGQERE